MFKILAEKYGDNFSWSELKNERRKIFEARLAVELTPEHSLYSSRNELTAVAKNERNDDVLFDDGKRYYNIHLTWKKETAIYPKYLIIKKEDLCSFLENDYLFG